MKTSVAICTYNGEKYLREQLDSILNQSVSVDEIVICDDRSNDGTHGIIKQYCIKYPNIIKFHINEVNLRSVKNFEKAISLCTNEIIFLSDQDDIWHLEKVKNFIKYFENHPKIDVLASNGFCIDDNSKIHEKYSVWDVPHFLTERGVAFNYHKIICYVSNIATGASMAFRKSICNEILPFPIMKDFHHDEWIAVLSSKRDAFVMLHEKYFYYRIHENQQVGGVFFDKTEKNKKMLFELFNYDTDIVTFVNLKKRIKKMIKAYCRNKEISEIDTKYVSLFKENIIEIKRYILLLNQLMKKKYPVLNFCLKVSDKVLGKRQFKH
jgi:glycosyltransferase involved in cell wall biosynthesis